MLLSVTGLRTAPTDTNDSPARECAHCYSPNHHCGVVERSQRAPADTCDSPARDYAHCYYLICNHLCCWQNLKEHMLTVTQVTLPLEVTCDLFYSPDHHCVVASITCWRRWGGDHAQPVLFTWSLLCSCWQDHELHLLTEVTHLQEIMHSLCCSPDHHYVVVDRTMNCTCWWRWPTCRRSCTACVVHLITTVLLLIGPWAAPADGGDAPAGDHAQPLSPGQWTTKPSSLQRTSHRRPQGDGPFHAQSARQTGEQRCAVCVYSVSWDEMKSCCHILKIAQSWKMSWQNSVAIPAAFEIFQ